MNLIKDTAVAKITGVGTYLGVVTGYVTQDYTIYLSSISYFVGIVLGVISIALKFPDFMKLFKK